ncbi:polyphosphate kinase [Sphingomonas sp.]|uniref:polyphosphate kinase n=1 Tax=Sphingomonas sp. TaxID=28214 RepID=UPI0038AE069E
MAEWTTQRDDTLAALREHVGELQLPQIAHGRRAIILFEGLQGSAKKFALRELTAAFDPCHFTVHSTPFDRREASEGHWLARFWRQLPSAGNTTIFFRSWYRRVLDDRVLGRTAEETIPRVFDEINEFEAQQRDYGTLLVKLYFDVSADVQEQRVARRRQSPWRVRGADDDYIRADEPAYQTALEQLRGNTDTRWSPWRTIDGDDEQQAALAALEAVAEAWSKAMPARLPQVVTSPRVA